jgi:hypothetical protein
MENRGQDIERRFGEETYSYSQADSEAKPLDQQNGGNNGGTGSADHGPEGTVNTGSGAGLSSGNATGGATTGDDAHTAMPSKRQN